jgi:nitroimidazol reductase NimA-like FMN-containing flavoprotein (pyridoxamine 5'-phosphate oxidase superfamily)
MGTMTQNAALTTLQTDPVARQLLESTAIARLAYVWRDCTPRVVPMWFHWNGEEIIMGAPPNSPKMKVLAEHPEVAITIDSNDFPYGVLSIRGTATAEILDEVFPEYEAMGRRYLGEEGGKQTVELVRQTFPRWTRIAIRPETVHVIDFQSRFPSAWSS